MTTELIISLVASLLLSFLLSGLESAILSLGPARLRHAAKEGNRRALKLERLMARRELTLGSILLLNVSVNLLAFGLITSETVGWFGRWGYLIAFLISLPVYLIWIELLPKSIFKRTPLRLLCAFLPVLVVLDLTIRPFIQVLALPGRWIAIRLYGPTATPPGASRAEFRAYTEILERDGTLTPRETSMIQSVLDFQQVRVSEVMAPLSKVTSVPPKMPVEAIVKLARQTKLEQFPLMAPNGELIGIIDVADLLRDPTATGPAHQYRHKLVQSEPAEPAIAVLRRLRQAGHQIAAVYSPGGRPIGVVSVEEMVERMMRSAS